MRDEEISTFLGQVTDKGLMCLFVLWAKPQPVTIGDIEIITGIGCKTISGALNRLKLHGYAAEVGGGRWPRWTLIDRGRQLSLPGLTALPDQADVSGEVMRKNYASLPPTTTALLSPSETVKAVAVEVMRKNYVSLPPTESEGEKITLNPQVVAALKAAGIGCNLHAELCALDHVTEAYVTAHDAYRRGRGESTGMLITRLRCGDAVPAAVTVKSSRPKIMRR